MFKVVEDGQLPTRGSKYSACVDLYAREDVTIGAGETKLIPLGVAIGEEELNQTALHDMRVESLLYPHLDYDKYSDDEKISMFKEANYLQLMLRSSLSKELIIANGVGVIDLDYKDEIMIRVHYPLEDNVHPNDSKYIIKKGQRVAQITLLEHKGYLFGIDTEDEREGGFGSTNKKDKR